MLHPFNNPSTAVQASPLHPIMTMLNVSYILLVLGLFGNANAFSAHHLSTSSSPNNHLLGLTTNENQGDDIMGNSDRRTNLQQLTAGMVAMVTSTMATLPAYAEDTTAREQQRKYIQESYEDFTKTNEGWLYREVKAGSGDRAREGDRVVFDWSGYTIGYFGRPFQAKG